MGHRIGDRGKEPGILCGQQLRGVFSDEARHALHSFLDHSAHLLLDDFHHGRVVVCKTDQNVVSYERLLLGDGRGNGGDREQLPSHLQDIISWGVAVSRDILR